MSTKNPPKIHHKQSIFFAFWQKIHSTNCQTLVMKRKLIKWSILFIHALPNLPVVGTIILAEIDQGYFRYANADGSYTGIEHIDIFSPWKDKTLSYYFSEATRPKAANMEIYRLYKINPLCFWRWRYYLTVSRHFNYRNWDEIKKNRTIPPSVNTRWQKF